jgi:hypothetical protein
MAASEQVENAWRSEKLKVVVTNTWGTSVPVMEAHLKDPNLYKYFFTGHGDKQDGAISPRWLWGPSLDPQRYTNHGIADMRLVACHTWTGRVEWAYNVSVNGQLETWKGKIKALSGTRVVQPGSVR